MFRSDTEEEKKLRAIIKPYFNPKEHKLVDNAPPEAIEARKRLIEIDRRIQMQECGIDQ